MATVTRENIGLLNDKITVKVTGEDYLPTFEKSLKNYSKTANIPGFRKGMVPAGLIRKMHGQSVFTDEVLRTIEKQLNDYMTKEQVEIFAQPLPLPENDASKLDMNAPAEYAFAFEIGLKPEFKTADLSKGKFTQYVVNITDEMIDEEIKRLQLRHGKMSDPETVTSDDNVLNVTFREADAAGNIIEGGITKDNSLLVQYFAESFRPGLMGKKAGETFTATLTEAFDAKEREWVMGDLGLDAHDAAAAGKNFVFDVTKVGMVERAELNEEFFKQVYPAKEITTEADFREAIKAEMQNHWSAQTRNQLHDQIFHALVDDTQIEFPETFLKRWMEVGGEKPKSMEEVEAEFPSFKNQLKWTLIVDQIVKDNKVEVLPDDIKAFARQQLFGYMGMNAGGAEEQPWVEDYVNRMMKDRKFVEDSFHRIQTEKVFGWAEGQVKTTDKSIDVEAFTKMVAEHKH